MHEQAERRADSAKLASNRRAAFGTNGRGVNARGVLTPFVHDEEEPDGTRGVQRLARRRRADPGLRHGREPACPPSASWASSPRRPEHAAHA